MRTRRVIGVTSVVMSMLLAGYVEGGPLDAVVQGVPLQLEQIQLGIDAVQNSVNQAAANINAIIPSEQSQTRFTPPVLAFSESSTLYCTVVNVAPAMRFVHLGAVKGDGTLHEASVTISLGPGTTTVIGPIVVGVSNWWCRFTVTDGSRTDIRAAIVLEDNETGGKITLAAE